MSSAGADGGYRPEIDGLRAFAVTAVIINHFNRHLLPGGYLGVDLFFVISGYVITSSLAARKSQNVADFLIGFYDRRIRRLLPALLVFVLVTSVLVCLFNPDPGVSLGVGWRALFGVSNLSLFAASTDYFGEATELNPFTHTWSLGVEEQFYLLFPLLIWFTGFGKQAKRGARLLFLWVAALALGSLAGFVWLYGRNHPAAYFLMSFRFWEMAAGCLVFLVTRNADASRPWSNHVPPLMLVAAMGALMAHPFAIGSITTLIVVLLTGLLMVCLKPGTGAYAAFTNPWVLHIGVISYSLYLWHWSVLAISRWTIGIHWWSAPFQLALILLIAEASYRWVEGPFRKVRSQRRAMVIATGTLAMVLGSAATMAIGRAGLYSGSLSGDSPSPRTSTPALSEAASMRACNLMEKPEEAIAISDACRSTHRAGRPTIYLLGDSHMSQFGTAIEAWAKQHRLNLAMVTGNGCLFPAAVIRGDEVACFERQRRIEKTLIGVLRQGDLVFIGNALFARFVPGWSEQPEAYKDADRRSIDSRTAANLYSARVQALSDQLNRLGAKVVFYSDGVQFAALDKLPGSLCRREWFRPAALVAKACTQSLHTHQLEMDRRFGWRHAWQDKRHRFSWDATRYRRDCDGDVCRATSYHDSNHFNEAYAAAVFHGFAADHPQLLSQDAVRR